MADEEKTEEVQKPPQGPVIYQTTVPEASDDIPATQPQPSPEDYPNATIVNETPGEEAEDIPDAEVVEEEPKAAPKPTRAAEKKESK